MRRKNESKWLLTWKKKIIETISSSSLAIDKHNKLPTYYCFLILQVLCHTLYAVDDTVEYDSVLPNVFFCWHFAEWVDIYISSHRVTTIYGCKTARMASFLRQFHSLKSRNFCSRNRYRSSMPISRCVAWIYQIEECWCKYYSCMSAGQKSRITY
jgi:hypothetical protein